MAGLLDWVDPAREWWKSRPEVIKGLLSGAYSMATDQATREAAMARLPKPFDRSVTGEQMMNNALNAGPSGLLGKIVYHGSPHKFDKFDASKIGTGEGAQAYGYGVYLADSEGVAKQYQKNLSPDRNANDLNTRMTHIRVGGRPVTEFGIENNPDLLEAAKGAGDPLDVIRKSGVRWNELANDGTYPFRDYAKEKAAAYKQLQSAADKGGIEYTGSGSLYKADLPDEWIPKMLDWDKPLSQQPDSVKKVVAPLLQSAIDTRPYRGGWGDLEPDHNAIRELFTKSGIPLGMYSSADAAALNLPGSVVIKALGKGDKESWRASEELRKLGIPGIRYLDGGSRSAGQGSYNYVVFPGLEDQIKILERNGVPLSGLLGR